MGNTSVQKGNELEKAIEMIERSICRNNPSIKEATLVIEPKKKLRINGVVHEIDLYVEINPGNGYEALFIFECKNWEESVGKNEIIIFSEKIKATKAQKGYFLSKKFGKYDKAQAKLDSRIELIEVRTNFELNVFPNTHFVIQSNVRVTDFSMSQKTKSGQNETIREALNLKKAIFILNGKNIKSDDLQKELIEKAIDERLKNELTHKYEAGIYKFIHKQIFNFGSKELICNKIEIEKCVIDIEFDITVIKPKIVSKFDVTSRGRVISFETINLPSGGKIDSGIVLTPHVII